MPFISRQLEFFPLDPLHLLFNQQMMAEIFHCVKDDQLAYRVARFLAVFFEEHGRSIAINLILYLLNIPALSILQDHQLLLSGNSFR